MLVSDHAISSWTGPLILRYNRAQGKEIQDRQCSSRMDEEEDTNEWLAVHGESWSISGDMDPDGDPFPFHRC
jgi:hypothetical protein